MMDAEEQKELLAIANQVYLDEALFIKHFNMSIESMDVDSASMRFNLSESLLGSVRAPNLHGGAIATVLDTVGSLAVFANVINRTRGDSVLEKVKKLEKGGKRLGTVDLRIDYLRPGQGKSFMAKGWILRTGHIIAVTRMELQNDEQKLIAVGTGTFVVG